MSTKQQKPPRQSLFKKQSNSNQPHNPTAHLNPKQKITYFLTNIQEKIIHQIDEHKQPISQLQSPFFDDQQNRAIKKNQEKLKILTEQKKITQERYKQLTEQEFQLKQQYKAKLKQNYYERKLNDSRGNQSREYLRKYLNNKTERLKDSKLNISQQNQFLNDLKIPHQSSSLKTINTAYKLRPKSQLTNDDIKTLKKLKQQYQKFEQQLSSKTIKHNEQLQKIKNQNLQFEEMMKKQKSQKKRKQIELKLQDLQRLKNQRIKKYEDQKIKLLQVKKRPKRFERLLKDFQDKEKQFEERKIEQMKIRIKRDKMFNLNQISQHEKKYQQLREENLKEIQEKYLNSSKILKESRYEPEQKSRFYRSVIEQERQRKLSLKKKQLATIQRCQRIKSYAQKVHQEYAPRLKSSENQEDEDIVKAGKPKSKEQEKQQRALSVEDRKLLGNDYLKEVIKHLKQKQNIKSNQRQGKKSSLSFHTNVSKSSHLPPISSISTKYKDYLAQQRTKHGSPEAYQEHKEKRAKLKYTNSIEQVKKMMNEDFTKKKRYETIDKIKEITQRLEHNQNQTNYIDKIRAKIEILETIT